MRPGTAFEYYTVDAWLQPYTKEERDAFLEKWGAPIHEFTLWREWHIFKARAYTYKPRRSGSWKLVVDEYEALCKPGVRLERHREEVLGFPEGWSSTDVVRGYRTLKTAQGVLDVALDAQDRNRRAMWEFGVLSGSAVVRYTEWLREAMKAEAIPVETLPRYEGRRPEQ